MLPAQCVVLKHCFAPPPSVTCPPPAEVELVAVLEVLAVEVEAVDEAVVEAVVVVDAVEADPVGGFFFWPKSSKEAAELTSS
jgi:hypothetical protein